MIAVRCAALTASAARGEAERHPPPPPTTKPKKNHTPPNISNPQRRRRSRRAPRAPQDVPHPCDASPAGEHQGMPALVFVSIRFGTRQRIGATKPGSLAKSAGAKPSRVGIGNTDIDDAHLPAQITPPRQQQMSGLARGEGDAARGGERAPQHRVMAPESPSMPDGISTASTGTPLCATPVTQAATSPSRSRVRPVPKSASMTRSAPAGSSASSVNHTTMIARRRRACIAGEFLARPEQDRVRRDGLPPRESAPRRSRPRHCCRVRRGSRHAHAPAAWFAQFRRAPHPARSIRVRPGVPAAMRRDQPRASARHRAGGGQSWAVNSVFQRRVSAARSGFVRCTRTDLNPPARRGPNIWRKSSEEVADA